MIQNVKQNLLKAKCRFTGTWCTSKDVNVACVHDGVILFEQRHYNQQPFQTLDMDHIEGVFFARGCK